MSEQAFHSIAAVASSALLGLIGASWASMEGCEHDCRWVKAAGWGPALEILDWYHLTVGQTLPKQTEPPRLRQLT